MPSARQIFVYISLAFILLFFILYPVADRLSEAFPDLVNNDENRRVVIVGDIHGMHEKLLELLSKLSFNPSSDVLVSVGDILTKGPHTGSMAVLDFLASNNATAVRGNHDQKVLEWRSWLNWIQSMKGGQAWLKHAIKEWENAQEKGEEDIEDWVDWKMKHDTIHRKWWRRVPNRQFLGDHFEIAMEMSTVQYDYLKSLPLKLHIPHAHAFIVHGGLLASDPNYKPTHSRQPLAKVPKIPKHLAASGQNSTRAYLRRAQEDAILTQVPQNMVTWNVQNMRGVTRKTNQVTKYGISSVFSSQRSDGGMSSYRDKEGRPWSKLWKNSMSMCAGFESEDRGSLPCMPATVIYGHAASRGLDIKRWSIGLDTGCVYKRQLTALVLGGKDNVLSNLSSRSTFSDDYGLDDDLEDDYDNLENKNTSRQKQYRRIRFGDNGWGRIVSVQC
ncbi:hypothetical protein D9758_003741 [Tetrapyrgos nigripes]|uniref:Calcineurin-like phosphoesterase domain-containing protein n=1 Tax=Tetrapyrgos nigripes TaxID=182062 RepID=A0A8H5LS53_9AGAR|nr:hypothetical protein D9758_003741 [Tetrapyrgos nigripes]